MRWRRGCPRASRSVRSPEPLSDFIHGYRVHLCFGPNCSPRGSRALLPVLESAIRRAGLADHVEIIIASCRDRCDFGPSMNVYPGPVFYNHLTEAAIEEIVEQHLIGGQPVARWMFRPITRQTTKKSSGQWRP